MKKKILVLFLLALLLIPFNVSASKTYKSLNLVDTLKEENIDKEFKNYSENNNQITIYMFRGKGCGYCRAFLNFLNSITEEYGKYFKLESYEVWYDSNNKKLMDDVSSFLGQPAQGVPYIIIGDKVFPGYAADYDEQIKEQIVKLYKTNKSDRYDVMKEYNKTKNTNVSSTKIIIWNLVVVLVAAIGIILFINTKFNKINENIEKISKNINKTNKETKKK